MSGTGGRVTGLLAGTLVSLVALAGCDSGPRRLTVTGKVTVGDTPLATGTVTFVPDAARSPGLKDMPRGTIENGSYTLYTDAKPGAPAGSYKVVVVASAPPDPKNPYALPTSLINKKYTTPETTDVSVEVVASPPAGAYDLKLVP